MVVGLGKSALMHTVRFDEQPTKRSKQNDEKSPVATLKKNDWQERGSVTDQCHDRSGKPDKRSDEKLGQKSSKRRLSDARQLGCVLQEELRHAETNPTCEIHKGYCASH